MAAQQTNPARHCHTCGHGSARVEVYFGFPRCAGCRKSIRKNRSAVMKAAHRRRPSYAALVRRLKARLRGRLPCRGCLRRVPWRKGYCHVCYPLRKRVAS